MNLNEQINRYLKAFDECNKLNNSSNVFGLNTDTALSYLIFLQVRLNTDLQLSINPDLCEVAGTTSEQVTAEISALSEILNQVRIPGAELNQEHKR